jgi:hypothetical protein
MRVDGRAKAVIDVDDSDARGASVEHREQRGDSIEAGPIPHAGGHTDDGAGDQAAYHAGQGALHACYANDYISVEETLVFSQQAVHTGNADIIGSLNPAPKERQGLGSFLGDRLIGGAAGDNETIRFVSAPSR